MSVTKRVAKNFSWLIVGSGIGGVLNFLAVVYLARVLGAENFGWMQFAIAILAYLTLFVDSGLSLFGIREIAREKTAAAKIVLNIYILRIIIGLIVFIAAYITVLFMPINTNIKLILLGTFIFVFSKVFSPEWVFQGLEKMEYVAMYKMFFASLYMGTILLFVKINTDILPAVYIRSFLGLLASVLFIFILYKVILRLDFKDVQPGLWKRYFWLAMPLGASTIMIQIYNNMDTVMLGIMDKPQVVGYYNAAYQIYYAGLGIFYVWLATAIPIMSYRIKENYLGAERFINKFSKISLLAVIPLVFLIALAAPLIIKILYGQEYFPAALALRFLIWNLIIVAIGSIYGALILMAAGKFNEFFKATLFGALVNVVLNFVLIPPYSFVGAAVATLIAETLSMIIACYYAKKVIPIWISGYLFRAAIFSLLASAVYVLISIWTDSLSIMLQLLIGAMSFVLTYALIIFIAEREAILDSVGEVFGARK
ncbi:MAG: flippase [Candidatus Margulisiibacteriota bacterium]